MVGGQLGQTDVPSAGIFDSNGSGTKVPADDVSFSSQSVGLCHLFAHNAISKFGECSLFVSRIHAPMNIEFILN